MNLEARKYNFIQELTKVDESVLEKLELVLQANRKDWYDELSDVEKDEIQIGITQADNNEFLSHEEVMNVFSKWQ